MRNKIIIIFMLFCMFFLMGSSATTSQSDDGNQTTINVYYSATEYDYPPFSVTEDGEADGFSVELLKAVGTEMGFEVRFEIDYWNVIKNKLINDELDVLPLVGYTDERDTVFDFTIPYIVMRGNIFVRKGYDQINSEADLFGKEILVLDGDNSQEWAISIGLDDELIATETYTEAFDLLSQGNYDAVLANGLVGQKIIADNNYDNVEPVYVYDDDGITRYKLNLEGYEQKFCFAVTEGDAELLSVLNEGLAIVSQNGTYDELYQKWFPFLIEENPVTLKDILTYSIPIFVPIIAVFLALYIYTIRKRIKTKTQELERIYGHNQIIIKAFKKEFRTNKDSYKYILHELSSMADAEYGILFSINEEEKISLRAHSFEEIKDETMIDNLNQTMQNNKLIRNHIKNKEPLVDNNINQTVLKLGKPENNISNFIMTSVQGLQQTHAVFLFNTDHNPSEDIKQVTIMLAGLWSLIEKQDQLNQIEYISYHDSLTGLYNRRYFDEKLKQLDQKRNFPITIGMGDVNGLKTINDAFGHDKGDELLKRVGDIINQASRKKDIIARWGGDEFAMILPRTSPKDAEDLINHLHSVFDKRSTKKFPLSVSFGFDTKTTEDQDIETVFLNAERIMYKHKPDIDSR